MTQKCFLLDLVGVSSRTWMESKHHSFVVAGKNEFPECSDSVRMKGLNVTLPRVLTVAFCRVLGRIQLIYSGAAIVTDFDQKRSRFSTMNYQPIIIDLTLARTWGRGGGGCHPRQIVPCTLRF